MFTSGYHPYPRLKRSEYPQQTLQGNERRTSMHEHTHTSSSGTCLPRPPPQLLHLPPCRRFSKRLHEATMAQVSLIPHTAGIVDALGASPVYSTFDLLPSVSPTRNRRNVSNHKYQSAAPAGCEYSQRSFDELPAHDPRQRVIQLDVQDYNSMKSSLHTVVIHTTTVKDHVNDIATFFSKTHDVRTRPIAQGHTCKPSK